MGKLDGKVVVVTGGARGMGRATEELAAKEGAKVAICDIKDQLGDEAARKIVEAGGTARYYHIDITKESDVGRTFSRPEEIAKGVLFLLSDDSSFMTGSELVIDGGYTSV